MNDSMIGAVSKINPDFIDNYNSLLKQDFQTADALNELFKEKKQNLISGFETVHFFV